MLKPVPPLSDFIENLWIYEGYSSPHSKERILPSGTFELVFNLRDDELRIYKAMRPDKCVRLSGAIVSGPYEGFFVTDGAEEASVVGVHFKPGGAFPFLGSFANELADAHIDMKDLLGGAAGEIRERLSDEHSPERRFQILEQALLSGPFRLREHHPAVSLALERFRQDTSRGAVGRLAREAGISHRRFLDVFKFEVGINPKIFLRIQRFQNLLRVVNRSPQLDWAQLAPQHGYFDQSHLIRDFLAFSGLGPADYLRRLRDLRNQRFHIKFNHIPLP
jgi:AraC-like DNA-binding protein